MATPGEKRAPQLLFDLAQRKFLGALPSDNDKVSLGRELMAVAAKKLSKQPLDPIADHCLPHFGAHRDAQSTLTLVVIFAKDNKMGGVNPSPSP